MAEVGVYNAPLQQGGKFTPLILYLGLVFGTGYNPTNPAQISQDQWYAMADYQERMQQLRVAEYTGG